MAEEGNVFERQFDLTLSFADSENTYLSQDFSFTVVSECASLTNINAQSQLFSLETIFYGDPSNTDSTVTGDDYLINGSASLT